TSGGIITDTLELSTELQRALVEVALAERSRYYRLNTNLHAAFTAKKIFMFETQRPRKKKSQNAGEAVKLRGDQAILLVAASEGDANMLYAVGFFVPDPFIFFQHREKKFAVLSDLEIDRAKKQAHVHRVLSLSLYQRKLRQLGKPAAMIDVLDLIFR